MCKDLSRGMKVNEFADLTTSEFVSEYPEENPNIVWSGRKHLETHEYINEPLDRVKPDGCFQSSDEGPSMFFSFSVCRLESELNFRKPCVVILHSQSSAHLSHLHWTKTQGLGCEQKSIILASRCHVHGLLTSSCVHWSVRLNRTYFLVTDIIKVFIWIFYHHLTEPNCFIKV